MTELRRLLAAVGFGVFVLPLWLAPGPAALFRFLGTWPLTALLGLFGGRVFVPDPRPA